MFFFLPCCCFWPWSRAAWSFDRECTRCQARLRTAPGSAISDTRDYGSDAYYISVLLSYFNYVYYAQRYGAEVFENKKLAELALDDTASSASESSSEEETPNASSSSSSGSSDNEGLDEKEIAEKKEKRREKRKGWSAPARCTAHPRTNAHIHSTRARRAMRVGCRKACNARLRLHCYIQHSNNACQLFFFFLSKMFPFYYLPSTLLIACIKMALHYITFLPHC